MVTAEIFKQMCKAATLYSVVLAPEDNSLNRQGETQ